MFYSVLASFIIIQLPTKNMVTLTARAHCLFEIGLFLDDTIFVLSAAFLTQTVCFDDTTVKFEIWDTAGQENILFAPIFLLYLFIL